MSLKIEVIPEIAPLLGGEGPHWDARAQALYFVDVPAGTIHKYTATAGHTKTKLDSHASFIIPVEGHLDQFAVAMGTEFKVLQWDGAEGSPARVVRSLGGIDAALKTRFNDGKADPRGRLFSGTMPQAGKEMLTDQSLRFKGALYRVDQGSVIKLDDKISLSNGLAWDQAAGAMYYVDSLENKIRRYDYDVETGNISNLSYIFDFEKNNIHGIPDGMTIDTDGNLWVVVFRSGCVYQVSPRGQLLRTVRLPVAQVTSCTFGGAELDILFVTSVSLHSGEGEQKPPSGRTFMISGLGVRGLPSVNVSL